MKTQHPGDRRTASAGEQSSRFSVLLLMIGLVGSVTTSSKASGQLVSLRSRTFKPTGRMLLDDSGLLRPARRPGLQTPNS